MGWDNLPQEILLQILENVQEICRSQLPRCQLTCRSWNKSARKLYYSTVSLQNPVQTMNLISFINKYNLNKSVKRVFFKSSFIESPEIEHMLPLFFFNCQHIVHIETGWSNDDSFWVKLIEEFHKGVLSKVQELPRLFRSRDSSIKIYGYLTKKLLNTLTTVQIWDWPHSDPSFQNCAVSQNLPEFRSLRNLIVHVGGVYNATKIVSLVKNCNNLKSIIIVNDTNRICHISMRDLEEEIISSPILIPTVKTIRTSMVLVTSNLLRQLIYFFPNLYHLYLNPMQELDYDLEAHFEEDMSFIFRMQTEGLEIPTDLWIQFISYVYEKLDVYQLSLLFFSDMKRVLSTFIQTSNFRNQGIFKIMYVRRSNALDIQPYVAISSNDREIKVVYETKTVYHRTERAGHESITSKLPHMDLLKSIGEYIQFLDISISPIAHFDDGGDCRHYNNASGYFLDKIFKRCTSLTKLYVSNAYLIACDPEFEPSLSIKDLRLFKSFVCPIALLEISERLEHCLSDLFLGSIYFLTSDGHIQSDNDKYIWINMPFSNFSSLSFVSQDRVYRGCSQFNLKIEKRNSVFDYFIGTDSGNFSKSSEAEYTQSLTIDNALIIFIKCFDIRSMFLHIPNLYFKITFHKDSFEYTCQQMN